jgi:ferredoxin
MAMSEQAEGRLRVNPILCNGFGYCAEIVPELISLDDWGFPIVSSRTIEDENLLHLARRAVTTCPRLALLIEEIVPAPLHAAAINKANP